MQFVIEVNGRSIGRLAIGLAVGAVAVATVVPRLATAGSVTTPNGFTAGTTISASAMNANFAALEAEINDNHARLQTLETLLAGVTRSGDTVVFGGLNVQVHNGAGATQTSNGTGNLVLGYNANSGAAPRTGSHNLIVGDDHGYTGAGGIAAGVGHSIADESYCIGGESNVAARLTTIVGGFNNETQSAARDIGGDPDSYASVIVGGVNNRINGKRSVIVGGQGTFIDFDAGEAVGTGFDGNQVTLVGGLNGDASEDGHCNIGPGAPIADLGLDAGFAYVGDGAGNVDVGYTAGLMTLGTQATTVHLGRMAGYVALGTQAQDAIVGEQAVNVNVGSSATGGVEVGGSANSVGLGNNANQVSVGATAGVNGGSGLVMLGQGADSVAVGNWAKNNVSLGFEAGKEQGTGTVLGTGNVDIGASANGFVNLGFGASTVGVGP